MVASGAPERTEEHAQNVVDLSLSMIDKVNDLHMPSGGKVEIRIGKKLDESLSIYLTIIIFPCLYL